MEIVEEIAQRLKKYDLLSRAELVTVFEWYITTLGLASINLPRTMYTAFRFSAISFQLAIQLGDPGKHHGKHIHRNTDSFKYYTMKSH